MQQLGCLSETSRSVKGASLKMLHTVRFHFCDILEKMERERRRTDLWLSGVQEGWRAALRERAGEVFWGVTEQFCTRHHYPGGGHMTLHVSRLTVRYTRNKLDRLRDHLKIKINNTRRVSNA